MLAPERVAVVHFSGLAREGAVTSNTSALQSFIVAHQLEATGVPALARYNPPSTLWFMRGNELIIPVAGAVSLVRTRLSAMQIGL